MQLSENLRNIQELRQEIHQHPEVSGEETKTAKTIHDFIANYNPDVIYTGVGGTGLIAQFKGHEEGPAVTIRAELDALPIQEINDIKYKSEIDNKGHMCGHDGHMVIVAALAQSLNNNRPTKGTVNLLFQPAEETGQGAQAMLSDKQFNKLKHDYIFALHNLPGYDKSNIIIKKDVFASASKGVIIELEGKTSHAAEPENGNSPAQAVAEIIQKIKVLPETITNFSEFTLVTIVHAKIGERAFGTTPGKAVVMATLRAFNDEDLEILDKAVYSICQKISDSHKLKCKISETEVFSSTINNENCVEMIETAAQDNQLKTEYLDQPFRWSEDFGLFSQKFNGAMFGLGSGKDTPSLHNPNYDFPDEILQSGVNMFKSILKQLVY